MAEALGIFTHIAQQLMGWLDDNPVNYALLALVVYLAYPVLACLVPPADPLHLKEIPNPIPSEHSGGYSWMPAKHPETTVWTYYTPKILRPFDGIDGGKILFAIRGKVYDVSSGRNFYGPDGPYGNFAGRDASRGLAKQSFDEDMLTPIDQPIDTLSDLTAREWDDLREWEMHFSSKYFVCGEFGPEL